MAVKKLRLYFQAHTIIVLTSYPITSILHKLDTSGRLLKWVVELSEADIMYDQRYAIKGQVLADFMVEISDIRPCDIGEALWILEIDGSSKAAGGGANMVLQPPKGLSIAQAVKFTFLISNNEAEYEALLLRLQVAKELSVSHPDSRSDPIGGSKSGFEARDRTGTFFFLLNRTCTCGYGPHLITESTYHIHIQRTTT